MLHLSACLLCDFQAVITIWLPFIYAWCGWRGFTSKSNLGLFEKGLYFE